MGFNSGATAPLYVLAQNPQLFVGPPFTVLVMGETEVVTTSNPNALPAGWEQRVHPSGKVYFIDHNTKKTSWRDPRLPNAASANEEEAALPTYHSLARIRALQRETHLEDVEMETLLQVFREEAGAGDAATSDEANAATLDHDQFANCLNRLLPTDDTTVDDDRAKVCLRAWWAKNILLLGEPMRSFCCCCVVVVVAVFVVTFATIATFVASFTPDLAPDTARHGQPRVCAV